MVYTHHFLDDESGSRSRCLIRPVVHLRVLYEFSPRPGGGGGGLLRASARAPRSQTTPPQSLFTRLREFASSSSSGTRVSLAVSRPQIKIRSERGSATRTAKLIALRGILICGYQLPKWHYSNNYACSYILLYLYFVRMKNKILDLSEMSRLRINSFLGFLSRFWRDRGASRMLHCNNREY